MTLLPDALCHGDAFKTLDFEIETLHSSWGYTDACCIMLNKEWPRSRTARFHSLMCSSRHYPASLVLLGRDNEDRRYVVGHSRLCRVLEDQFACWIESVIIDDRLRGKGLGRVLMTKTEIEAKKSGFTKAYLTTTDRVGFYQALGYHVCQPVIATYGGIALRNAMMTSTDEADVPEVPTDRKPHACFSRLFRFFKKATGNRIDGSTDLARHNEPPPRLIHGVTYAVRTPLEPYGDTTTNSGAPPPPPPPPMPETKEQTGDAKQKKSFLDPKVFMTKDL